MEEYQKSTLSLTNNIKKLTIDLDIINRTYIERSLIEGNTNIPQAPRCKNNLRNTPRFFFSLSNASNA